jgi:uncharacterized damage-inducible protein DinB
MSLEFPAEISRFYLRELDSLRREIEAYPDDESIWRLPPGAPNSAGTLTLHVCGNLQHYLGALLGGTGYVRDRDAEFATRDLSRGSLIDHVSATERAISSSVPTIGRLVLADPFPEPIRGETLSTREALLHLATHLAYHIGQVDYHRRLVSRDPKGIDAISPIELKARA